MRRSKRGTRFEGVTVEAQPVIHRAARPRPYIEGRSKDGLEKGGGRSVDSPDTWRWIWLTAAVAFGVGEMATAGAFFLLPFGVGAAVAAVLAFLGVSLGWEWLTFLLISGAAFASLRPLARRVEAQAPMPGVGASRWVGRVGSVLGEIPPGPAASGLVRIDREDWRAESADGRPIAVGTMVRVVRVEGTRVVVEAVTDAQESEHGEAT